MDTHYGSWVPHKVLAALFGGASVLGGCSALANRTRLPKAVPTLCALGAAGLSGIGVLALKAHHSFDLDRPGSMASRMVRGTAGQISVPDGGRILDIGCGSGALTIECAKRYPKAQVVGIDRWKLPYDYYSRELCETNAKAQGVTNATFMAGDARALDFPDESFDAVVSNFVYHNVPGTNRHDVLREALRVVKKGGYFAIHDTFMPLFFGDIHKFITQLKQEGYEDVELVPTGDGLFIQPFEKRLFFLYGVAVLRGKK